MNKKSSLKRILKTVHKLSPGFLILGICLMAWASYQIYTQSAPAPVSIEQPAEEPELAALASETDAEDKTETQTETEKDTKKTTETNPENQTETAADADAEQETQNKTNSEENEETNAGKEAETSSSKEAEPSGPKPGEVLYPTRPKTGENIGNLTLPAIDQVLPIIHGTDEDELKRGIGHFAGSVLPGENDNSVLSGHRDTVFKELGQLEINDELIVETSAGTFTYEIREIKIVPSDDKTIITPSASPVLTVTTCYPFNFVGSAPDRYILIADLVSSE